MKRFVLTFLILIMIFSCLVFVGCKNDVSDSNKKVFISISFDTNGIQCTAPETQVIEISSDCIVVGLPIPSDAPEEEGYDLAWFFDKDCKNEFSPESLPNKDATLYLGYTPKVYSITYTNRNDFEFEGEFKDSYIYGEKTALPNVNLGVGYLPDSGNWFYGEGENDFYTKAIPQTAMGDLVLTFKPCPIKYNIVYVAGDGVEMENPNVLTYDITMGKIELLPASAEGKTFSHWEYRSVMSKSKKIEYIDFELISQSMSFSLWAIWE